jgi:uncharacterized protein (UPF0335 family)
MRKKSRRKRQGLKVDSEAGKVLRKLMEEEAFHFYAAVDRPTGESARSLSDFLDRIKRVNLESLEFHHQRKDFQNWIKSTLGDSRLARRIGRIRPSHNDDVRMKMCTTVENRIKELEAIPLALSVTEDLVVAT